MYTDARNLRTHCSTYARAHHARKLANTHKLHLARQLRQPQARCPRPPSHRAWSSWYRRVRGRLVGRVSPVLAQRGRSA
eukprot:5129730-Pleurochrysis_carterae.AAC.1